MATALALLFGPFIFAPIQANPNKIASKIAMRFIVDSFEKIDRCGKVSTQDANIAQEVYLQQFSLTPKTFLGNTIHPDDYIDDNLKAALTKI